MPRSARTAAAVIVVVALLTLLPFVGGDYYIYLFALVFINVILAASLRPSLSCGQLNIGHSAFNLLSGFIRPTAGTIRFDGDDITRLRPHQVVRRGLVRTFQLTTLFQEMTALENVLLGLHLHSSKGLGQVLFSRRTYPPEEVARSREVLDFAGLSAHADQLARNLPHGHQRALGIAMALAARPRLLLLDEPVTGMNLDESGRVMALVKTIRDRGITILLVEHNMKAVMGTCERIVVLNFGQKLAEGTPADVSTNASVIEAYLGAGLAHA